MFKLNSYVYTNIKAVIVALSLDEFQIKVNELFREIEFGNNRLFINDLITQNNLRVVPKGIKTHNFVQLFLITYKYLLKCLEKLINKIFALKTICYFMFI